MNESQTCGGAAARRENHLELDQAVNSIDQAISRAERLLSRIINGDDSKPIKVDAQATDAPDRLEPTLAQVLSNAPQAIRDKVEHLHNLTDQISDALF